MPLLSRNCHGDAVRPGPGLTIPQNWSSATADAQLAAAEVASSCRLPETAVFHTYTLIVEVPPPLLKSLMTSRSPFLCVAAAPVSGSQKPVPPPITCGQAVSTTPSPLASNPVLTLFWKNQKPCCASPLLSKRSEPKKITSQVAAPPEGQLALGATE